MAGFDARLYGALLFSLRRLRGFDRASDLADKLTDIGVKTSERSVWAIERGDQVAGVDRHFALCELLRPSPGYFEGAFEEATPDEQETSGQ